MTIINSQAFQSISTTANPALLSRALQLINNSSLSSLEPMRNGLTSGNVTIRIATAEDKIPVNAHAMYVEGANVGAGQIIVRSEFLQSASDAQVLQFVDDLRHEYGHHEKVQNRKDLLDALISGTGTPEERGNVYVTGWIDEEANARLASYGFRQQVAELPGTDYKISNIASLNTDPLYKQFAELTQQADQQGLTGQDRTNYIVQNSRSQMAGYDASSYREVPATYVALALRMTPEQALAFRATIQEQIRNAVPFEISSETYDDGSCSVTVNFSDGRALTDVYDVNQQLFSRTTTIENGSGKTVSTEYPAGRIDALTYNSDGTLFSHETTTPTPQGSVTERFNAGGDLVLTTTRQTDPSGNAVITTTNPDGSGTAITTQPDGTVTQTSVTSLQPNGDSHVVTTDGNGVVTQTSDISHDDDGNTLIIITQADGSGIARALESDGTLINETTFERTGGADGATGTLTDNINGKTVELAVDFATDQVTGINAINGAAPLNDPLIDAALQGASISTSDLIQNRRLGDLAQLVAAGDGADPTGVGAGPVAYDATAFQRFGDALPAVQSLLAGLKSGQSLPIASGLFGLDDALKRGDVLAAAGHPASGITHRRRPLAQGPGRRHAGRRRNPPGAAKHHGIPVEPGAEGGG